MVSPRNAWSGWRYGAIALLLASGAIGERIIETTGYKMCMENSFINIQRAYIKYDQDTKVMQFDISATSTKSIKVDAELAITAYGKEAYTTSFNPCDEDTKVEKLCPVPDTEFIASGRQDVPEEAAGRIPDIAFQVPDISATATLKLKKQGSDEVVACIQAEVSNGKTANVPAVSYVAAGIMGVSLLASGAATFSSAISGDVGPGNSISPGFTEMAGWFQGMAMNGMMSVDYPPVYRSFSQNFAFSTGMIALEPIQVSIDTFRKGTGGNLTDDSVPYLKNDTNSGNFLQVKRAFEGVLAARGLAVRDEQDIQSTMSGIKQFAEKLRVPKSDIFMTVLLILAIIIAAIILFMVLFKGILELWAMYGTFPPKLAGFRKHYWGSIARVITSLILTLYGIWVLYCVFQFTSGDSWAATTLAAVTLAVFTGVLAFFGWKIWSAAQKAKKLHGDTGALYDDKETWVKYSIFYESYRRGYWWLFIPVIFYMAAKGILLAAADGSGKTQTIAILIVESIMLIFLLWSRPFERKSGNVVNIVIQVVRWLSVICILVFVREFGISEDTKTVTGVALIAVQSTLTVVLVVLMVWHACMHLCQSNRHREHRKELEKMQMDDLTPLDARNSLYNNNNKFSDRKSVVSVASSHRGILIDHPSNRNQTPDNYHAAEEGRWPYHGRDDHRDRDYDPDAQSMYGDSHKYSDRVRGYHGV